MNTILFFVSLLSLSKSTAVSSASLLGVSPEVVQYYKAASEFVSCKDGSKRIRVDQLNDDFCDCADGSDEPGTPACPNGKFYCRNAGHTPRVLFSSRVNDGICDCCDGSDESDGKVNCPNTCWEAGKAARDKLQKKIVIYRKGLALQKEEIGQAELAFEKDEAKLTKLKNEEKVLKGVVEDLQGRKEKIEKAEEKERKDKERLEKEKEVNIKKEANKESSEEIFDGEKAINEEGKTDHGTYDDSIGNIEATSHQAVEEDNAVTEVALEEDLEATESQNDAVDQGELSEGDKALSKEELGRRVASCWTGENAGRKTGEADSLNVIDGPGEIPKDVHDEEYDDLDSESYGDDERYGHYSEDNKPDDFKEDNGDSSSSYTAASEDKTKLSGTNYWLKKVRKTLGNILEAVNLFQTPVNISDASRVLRKFDEYNSKLSKVQSEISSLSEKLKHDFGPEKEFYSFYDRCFKTKESKYVYKVCPYKQATQTEGHITTRSGHWEGFEESHEVMLFSNGDRCWNGPDRSLKVRLRCGLENEITDVDEPSRCEYIAFLSTPNVCHEKKLKELESKLEMMNKQLPDNHDEL